LPADHPDKHLEIGSEPDPGTFLDTLLALTAEWGRVLAPWGSIAIELGDTFAGSGGAGGDYNAGGLREGQNAFVGSSSFERRTDTKRTTVSNGTGSPISDLHGKVQVQGGGIGRPRPKCLTLIPQAYAMSLAYGFNVITGQPSPAGQWLVRNQIVWHRPNPAVGALGDKFRPSTSYITVATRSTKRWFDLTAVRTEAIDQRTRTTNGKKKGPVEEVLCSNYDQRVPSNAAGAPPLDCWFDHHDTWTLTTQPSPLSHYAMWPAKLAERIILSMCPAWVCRQCGEPRRRVGGGSIYFDSKGREHEPQKWPSGMSVAGAHTLKPDGRYAAVRLEGGWSDCGHGDYTPGTVLDPFAGTFTTGLVAEYHERDAVGIDIDSRNADMIPQRREEIRRNLNPTHIRTINGQQDLFGPAA
jgi:hypothetical protein